MADKPQMGREISDVARERVEKELGRAAEFAFMPLISPLPDAAQKEVDEAKDVFGGTQTMGIAIEGAVKERERSKGKK